MKNDKTKCEHCGQVLAGKCDDIPITEEMIEAGVGVALDDWADEAWVMVKEVYLAMARLAPHINRQFAE